MDDLVAKAYEVRAEVTIKAAAHRASAEYHRHRHVFWGTVATGVTATASSGTIAGAARRIGLEGKITSEGGKDAILVGSMPEGFWACAFVVVLVLLLVAAPVLSALQAFLKDADQYADHKLSAEEYERIGVQIDTLLLRYARGGDREAALKDWNDVAMQLPKASRIGLTPQAMRAASKALLAA